MLLVCRVIGLPGRQALVDDRVRLLGLVHARGDRLRPLQPFLGQLVHIPGRNHHPARGGIDVLRQVVGG